MSLDAWIAVVVVALALAMLVRTRIAPYLVLLGGMVVLMTTGVLTPGEAVSGFSNEGMLTVAALFIVAAGLRETGAMSGAVQGLFGRTSGVAAAQVRMMLPVMATSAFINNTPVVAAFIPLVTDWARKFRISVSKLMLPLSYAAILGGTCTLIGTSTNLIVNGMLVGDPGQRGLGFFEIAWVGLPVAALGLVYVALFGRRLLPERIAAIGEFSDPREYTVEMLVTEPARRQDRRGSRATCPDSTSSRSSARGMSSRPSARMPCWTRATAWCSPASPSRSPTCRR